MPPRRRWKRGALPALLASFVLVTLATAASPTLGGASGGGTLAAQEAPPATDALVLEGVTVVDVLEGRLLHDRRVVVRDGMIAAVEATAAPFPRDVALTVSGGGLYVIPGLVDHHVHLTAGMGRALERALLGGVTLVNSMAGDNRAAGELQRATLAGELQGPEIAYASVMAGPGFFTDPRFLGAGLGYPPGEAPWARSVTRDSDLALAVAAARGSGAEVLKLYAMMDGELVSALAREAHRQGMRVVAHATVFPARPDELVSAGVDILTHAPYLSWQGAHAVRAEDAWDRRQGPYASVPPDGELLVGVLREMAERGTYLEPTLWVFDRSPADTLLQAWAARVTRAASAAGVPIIAGTDGVIDSDPAALPNIHREMAALVAAGLTPAEALAAATVTATRAMGRGDTHGLVAPGRVADLVLLEADPLEDIAATTRIRWVVRRGRLLETRR